MCSILKYILNQNISCEKIINYNLKEYIEQKITNSSSLKEKNNIELYLSSNNGF
jgi:hypothetical protein